MMTKMSEEGSEFEDVLKDAQQKGTQRQIRPLISRDMMPARKICNPDISGMRTAG